MSCLLNTKMQSDAQRMKESPPFAAEWHRLHGGLNADGTCAIRGCALHEGIVSTKHGEARIDITQMSTPPKRLKVYVIGSLRNPAVPEVSQALRAAGFEVFDDWYAAGEKADDSWQAYEQARGRSYSEGLAGFAAGHVFDFDSKHLVESDAVVLVLPAGKSGHMELGWAIGRGKYGAILLDKEPERWDVMYRFASLVTSRIDQIIEGLTRTGRVQ